MNNIERYSKELEGFAYNQLVERMAKELELYYKYFGISEVNLNDVINGAYDKVSISEEKMHMLWDNIILILIKKYKLKVYEK